MGLIVSPDAPGHGFKPPWPFFFNSKNGVITIAENAKSQYPRLMFLYFVF
jgi:hypothetical protein